MHLLKRRPSKFGSSASTTTTTPATAFSSHAQPAQPITPSTEHILALQNEVGESITDAAFNHGTTDPVIDPDARPRARVRVLSTSSTVQPVQQHVPMSPKKRLGSPARSRPALRRRDSFSPRPSPSSPHRAAEKVYRRNSFSFRSPPKGSPRFAPKPSPLKPPPAAVENVSPGADLVNDLASAAEALAAAAELNAVAVARVQALAHKAISTDSPTKLPVAATEVEPGWPTWRQLSNGTWRQLSNGIGAKWEQRMAGLLSSISPPRLAPSTPPDSPSSSASCDELT